MPTKSKIDRSACGARDKNGLCIPMGTPCSAVGDSICSPVQSAFTLGVRLMEMNEDQTIHAFGLCPFCHGVPIIKKPSWFGRIFLHKGPSVTCNRCGAKLIAFHEGFTGEEIVIHYPPLVWNNCPKNRLGHATLENLDEGIYVKVDKETE